MVVRKRFESQRGEDINHVNGRWFRLPRLQPSPLQWQIAHQTLEIIKSLKTKTGNVPVVNHYLMERK